MAQQRYYGEDAAEQQTFLDSKHRYPQHSRQEYQQPYQEQQYQQYEQYGYQQDSYAGAPPTRQKPNGAHPDSSFETLRARRRNSRDRTAAGGAYGGQAPAAAGSYAGASMADGYRQQENGTARGSPPRQPPPYEGSSHQQQQWQQQQQNGYAPHPPQRSNTQSGVTPGADNFSDAAAGGMSGIAYTVAERNARESGLEAVHGPNYPQQTYQQQGQDPTSGGGYVQQDIRGGGGGGGAGGGYNGGQPRYPRPPYASNQADRNSNSSSLGLSASAVVPGNSTPGARTPSRSPHSFATEAYSDNPYQNLSTMQHPTLGVVNPDEIEDDGDDGVSYGRRGPRTSMLSLGGSSHRGRDAAVAAGAVGAAAGAGGVMGALAGRNGPGGQYSPVNNANTAYQGAGGNTSAYNLGSGGGGGGSGSGIGEKLDKGARGRKWRLVILLVIGFLIIAGVALGIVFGVVLKNRSGDGSKNSSGSSSSSNGGGSSPDSSGDLNIDSPEIQALLNNANLHKVFPGIDYTPINTQYPDCLKNPPSQNNVTKDVAVLSQLTNTIRLYGTDCNQTEMVIHALSQLKMSDSVKIWLGVWQDGNATTNARQLAQMWTILDTYGAKPFKGLIVANEILFRQQMTAYQLGTLLSSVRANASAKGWNLPVATSDLGDNWTADLAQASDYIMANIHPFFGGINAKQAASWTWSFWENHNAGFFKADTSKNIISETGWPSQGGTDCGTTAVTSCPDAAVAGISQMNQFMSDWVCQALTNGTQYFWFEAFDEPWKVSFDTPATATTPAKEWEDHWGLMDVNRNLKDGVKIPDCGGKTVS